jgi:hypothetical protein
MNQVQTKAQRTTDSHYRVQPDNIPQELKLRPQWVVWRLEKVQGRPKPTKVPYIATGKWHERHASSTDPATWRSFDEALAIAQEHNLGIGYMMSGREDFYAVDLDANPDLSPEAQSIAALCNSYTERSPSGTGRRIFLKGLLPEGFTGRKLVKEQIEVYRTERYLTVTGDRVNGHDAIIEDPDTTKLVIDMLSRRNTVEVKVPYDAIKAEGEPPADWRERLRPEVRAYLEGFGPINGDPSSDDLLAIMDLLSVWPDGQWVLDLFNTKEVQPARANPEKYDRRDYLPPTIAKAWAFLTEGFNAEDTVNAEAPVVGEPVKKRIFNALELYESEEGVAIPERVAGLPLGVGLYLFAGPPKVGKSWAVLQLGLDCADGLPWLGHFPTEKCPVLYYALEDGPKRLRKRLRALKRKPSPLLELAIDVNGALLGFKEDVLRTGAKVAMIDTAAWFLGGGDSRRNEYQNDMLLYKPLKMLAEQLQITIIVVTHTRKPGQRVSGSDPFDEIMGSLGKMGVADGALLLRKIQGSKDKVELLTRIRDSEEGDGEFILQREEGNPQWVYLGTSDDVGNLDRRHEIIKLLREYPNSRPSELLHHIDISERQLYRLLRDMKEGGQVRVDTRKHTYSVSDVIAMSVPAVADMPDMPDINDTEIEW